jgi:hypothetical protein
LQINFREITSNLFVVAVIWNAFGLLKKIRIITNEPISDKRTK